MVFKTLPYGGYFFNRAETSFRMIWPKSRLRSTSALRRHLTCPHRKKPLASKPERHTDETDQNRHFDQWADYRRKRDRRAKTERADGDGNRKLKVIASGRESSGGGLAVIGTDRFPHEEADKEHNDKINCQRNSDTDHVQR